MFIAYAGILATNIVMTIVAVPVVGLFHLSPEATKTGLSLIHCFSIVAIFIWPLSFTMPNALRAAGDAKYTMMVSIFSMWAFRVGSSYLLGGTLGRCMVWYVHRLGIPFTCIPYKIHTWKMDTEGGYMMIII